MVKLIWDSPGARRFEAGVDRGVIYPRGQAGVAWNGLISVVENKSGGAPTPYYVDGIKYANVPDAEEFAATIEAFTYPEEFALLDGTEVAIEGLYVHQQVRRPFGFSYRSLVGNDLEGTAHGYKIHIIYNALAAPNNATNATLGDNLAPENFSWSISTTPVFVGDVFLPSAHLVVDTTKTHSSVIKQLEDRLYGTSSFPPQLPTPAELVVLLENAPAKLEIIPSLVAGLASLAETGVADLVGFVYEGMYTAPSTTRLRPTATPGLYTLEI